MAHQRGRERGLNQNLSMNKGNTRNQTSVCDAKQNEKNQSK